MSRTRLRASHTNHFIVWRRLPLTLAVVSASSCGSLEPPVRPGAVLIQVVTDTDTITEASPAAYLTAVLKDHHGMALDSSSLNGKVVTWQSDNANFAVVSTGPLTATAFGTMNRLATGEIAATLDSIQGSITLVACRVARVGIKTSQTLMLGRTVDLAGAGYMRSEYDLAFAASAARVEWESSDPGVLTLDGARLTAARTGTATVTASSCGVVASIDVTVVEAGYHVTPIQSTEPRREPIFFRAMNSAGQIAASVPGSPSYNFLWDDGTFTDLVECVPVAINDLGQILCDANGPTIWESGQATARDTLSGRAVTINNLGHVLIGGWLWRAPGNAVSLETVPYYWFSRLTGMNNRDEIIGLNNDYYRDAVLWHNGQVTRLPTLGRYSEPLAINDSGDVVGSMEGVIYDGRSDGYLGRRANGWKAEQLRPWETIGTFPPYNDVVTSMVSINNKGEIAGSGSQGPFIWARGHLTLLNDVLADTTWVITRITRINDRGQILAHAHRSFDPPVPSPCTLLCDPGTSLVRLDPPLKVAR